MRIKKCTTCKRKKSLKEFWRDKSRKDGYRPQCKNCVKKYRRKNAENIRAGKARHYRENQEYYRNYHKKYYQKNKDYWRKYSRERYRKNKDQFRKYELWRKFRLTPEQYDQMLIEQNNRCNICNTHSSKLKCRLHVHHNRKTGQVICLLCQKCNHALGLFNHDPELMEKAAALVRQHRKNS